MPPSQEQLAWAAVIKEWERSTGLSYLGRRARKTESSNSSNSSDSDDEYDYQDSSGGASETSNERASLKKQREEDTLRSIALQHVALVPRRKVVCFSHNDVEDEIKIKPAIVVQDACCGICLQHSDNVTREWWYLDCGHVMHRLCVCEWLERKANCPLCRTDHYAPDLAAHYAAFGVSQ